MKILDFGLAKIEASRSQIDAVARLETMGQVEDLTTPGTALGTVSFMSPEQARGQLTDARTDLYSLGTALYQMATGLLPFQGDTAAVVYEAILNRDPVPVMQVNPTLPAGFARILEKALEKDRNLRYQTATDLKTDLIRLKRDIDSGNKRAADSGESRAGIVKQSTKSVAVLYFENLSGAKEDEYFRDGITEFETCESKPRCPADSISDGVRWLFQHNWHQAFAELVINPPVLMSIAASPSAQRPHWGTALRLHDVHNSRPGIGKRVGHSFRMPCGPRCIGEPSEAAISRRTHCMQRGKDFIHIAGCCPALLPIVCGLGRWPSVPNTHVFRS